MIKFTDEVITLIKTALPEIPLEENRFVLFLKELLGQANPPPTTSQET